MKRALKIHTFLISLLLFLSLSSVLVAQQPVAPVATDSLAVREIHIADVQITGNKKTREYVIRRELSLHEGQLVPETALENLLNESTQRLSNTRLFLTVELEVIPLTGNHVRILVQLQERWYVVPMPVFKLADRNFNDWWVNQNRDLSRVNYGLKFSHYNFMGRAEKLSIWAQFGYTRSFRLGYYMPYIDKSRKNGLGINLLYYDNNNIALRTVQHKRVFLNFEEQELRKSYIAGLSFSRRSTFYTTHFAGLSFYANTFADTLLRLNPEYLPQPDNNNLRYFALVYGFNHDRRDNVSYPLNGHQLKGALIKTGLGIFNEVNIFEVEGGFSYHFPLWKKLYWSNAISARASVASKQPYYLLSGLGYGQEYVRGMELYVLEGQHHVLTKSEFKWQLFDKVLNISKLLPIDQFNKIPIAVYPKVYFDAAYVRMENTLPENNFLVNRPIWGIGAGIDIVSFYDFSFKLEYSLNSIGEKGLYVNMNKGF